MIVVGSANARKALSEAWRILQARGSALDAVEAAVRVVESDPEEQTVGYAGLPNLLGEVELDASIMDGRTLAAGAVGAVRGYEHPISIARKVMEELPHVLLVGPGAERFAREMGFPARDLGTPESARIWREGLERRVPTLYAERIGYLESLRRFAQAAADPERPTETVNVLARDGAGNLASAVSTSGWAWKYPGRLGDSPIIGAGNYADNRYGGAACTGRGEMAMRCATARSAVLYLKMGLPLTEAGTEAVRDLTALVDPYFGRVSLLVLDANGQHAGFSNARDTSYVYWAEGMPELVERARIY
ncbi:MAG TPA: N(4)-(beta-N-acetylglucosaminyl)-L-asparaginase, partial [Candidatus Sulfotelmatobacter sp.]|nr:N(4)-(beta-N-acetylglucosaminyl)-L-asparaginase [Candidatus Sulfotelmatobacter sp.]